MPNKGEEFILSYIFRRDKRWWYEKRRSDIVDAVKSMGILEHIDSNVCPFCSRRFRMRRYLVRHLRSGACSAALIVAVRSAIPRAPGGVRYG